MKQLLRHPKLGAGGTKTETLGYDSFVVWMCLACRWATKVWHLLGL